VEVAESLPKFLSETEGAGFNMGKFVMIDGVLDINSTQVLDLCGTTACLAGWYILLTRDPVLQLVDGLPYTNDKIGEKALQSYFDLVDDVNDELFYRFGRSLDETIEALHETFDEKGNLR
jgi:hypothetical protein